MGLGGRVVAPVATLGGKRRSHRGRPGKDQGLSAAATVGGVDVVDHVSPTSSRAIQFVAHNCCSRCQMG